MPSNDREVFDFLTGDTATPAEIDFITYAVFAFNKREWMAQFEAANNAPPQQANIDVWIARAVTERSESGFGVFEAAGL